MAAPATAQNMNALDALISGSSSAQEEPRQSDAVRDLIREKIMEMATQPLMQPNGAQNSAITIGEIDALNRTAERAKTDLELQKTSVERQRIELENLLALFEALKVIEGGDQANEDPMAQMMAGNASMEQPQPQGPQVNQPSPEDTERDALPRIDAIVGAGGNFEAYMISQDGAREVLRAGDFSNSGFEVISMDDGRVVLKGDATGNEYSLRPQAAPAPVENSGPGMGGQPNQAINLGGLPLGIF
jgi:hypothetical protein